ncbi:unnamed protein product [Cuscuta epithymum]|uniref:Uncharacterized protein n=1 Tax=Cuscuta epithymum TaxID=186058 RepID=A0AAV0FM99_9ASTE|nr:unnamed protein product [Cuscuta epithymum]
MASALHSSLSLSDSRILAPFPTIPHHSARFSSNVFHKKRHPIKRNFVCSHGGINEITIVDLPGNKESRADHIRSLKLKLLVIKKVMLIGELFSLEDDTMDLYISMSILPTGKGIR